MNVKHYLTSHSLQCNNWPQAYPDSPQVNFAIAHNGESIFLEFEVREQWSRAMEGMEGRVWEDSCVEMFLSPSPQDGIYYNLECNCAGNFLLRAGRDRHERVSPSPEVLSSIKAFSSVPGGPFEKKHLDCWKVALIIPKEAFFLHDVKTLDGAHFKGNFYKCGDLLPQPHFLSYGPIDTPSPDFHRPEFFVDILFDAPEDK